MKLTFRSSNHWKKRTKQQRKMFANMEGNINWLTTIMPAVSIVDVTCRSKTIMDVTHGTDFQLDKKGTELKGTTDQPQKSKFFKSKDNFTREDHIPKTFDWHMGSYHSLDQLSGRGPESQFSTILRCWKELGRVFFNFLGIFCSNPCFLLKFSE